MNDFQLIVLGKAKDDRDAEEIIELEMEARKLIDRKYAKNGGCVAYGNLQ